MNLKNLLIPVLRAVVWQVNGDAEQFSLISVVSELEHGVHRMHVLGVDEQALAVRLAPRDSKQS